jgi:hypothetical protein
MTMSVL